MLKRAILVISLIALLFPAVYCKVMCSNNTHDLNCTDTLCSLNCGGPDDGCNSSTGDCLHGCDEGFYGPKCQGIKCLNNTYGEYCNETCSLHCSGLNKDCDSITGRCLHGCEDGFYGVMCDEVCNPALGHTKCKELCPYCKYKKCNSSKHCQLGCVSGYHGKLCDEKCKNGRYGENCAETCNLNCAGPNNVCNSITGECLAGCDEGFSGKRCLFVDMTQSSLEEHVIPIVIGLGVLFSFLVSVLCYATVAKLSKNNELPAGNSSARFNTRKTSEDEISSQGYSAEGSDEDLKVHKISKRVERFTERSKKAEVDRSKKSRPANVISD